MIGGPGDDLLVGGAGADTASYEDAEGVVAANLTTGVSSGDRGVDSFRSIANLTGGMFADTLIGNGGANVLIGELFGGFGDEDDELFGQAGDDTLIGGPGNDALVGGSGNDTASYSDATGRVVADLDTGASGDRGVDTLLTSRTSPAAASPIPSTATILPTS